MPSLLDMMISAGAIPAVASTSGERIQVLSGQNAGQYFWCNSIEIDREIILQTELGDDPRSGWVIRFDPAQPFPVLIRGDEIQQDNGQVWQIVRLLSLASPPAGSGKTLDYEISEQTPKDT